MAVKFCALVGAGRPWVGGRGMKVSTNSLGLPGVNTDPHGHPEDHA